MLPETSPATSGAVPSRPQTDRDVRYRPRFDLTTGAVLGCEAMFAPLPIAYGGMDNASQDALAQACAEARHWSGRPVAVPLANWQLASDLLVQQVAEALDRAGLPAGCLELDLAPCAGSGCEIETLLTLSMLRDLGVGLALDGFGTGYAAGIGLLNRLPLTTVKLHGSLLHGLSGKSEDLAIAGAAIHTGHALGLTVLADGIETELQRALLCGLGCNGGQGDLFSAPLSAERVRALVAYGDETCSADNSTSETRYERSAPHRSQAPRARRGAGL